MQSWTQGQKSVTLLMLSNLQQSPKGGCDNISPEKSSFNMHFQHESNNKLCSKNQHGQSRGLGRRLWLSAISSRAKASIGPSLMARFGSAHGFEPGRAHDHWKSDKRWPKEQQGDGKSNKDQTMSIQKNGGHRCNLKGISPRWWISKCSSSLGSFEEWQAAKREGNDLHATSWSG